MAKIKKRLGEILIDAELITEDTLTRALELQKNRGMKLGEVLISEKFLTEQQIIDAIRKQLDISIVDLSKISIRQDILNILPVNLVKKYEVLPLDVVNGQLMVVMSDPLNYYAIEEIRAVSGYLTKTSIALRDSIRENIERYYGRSKAVEAVQDYSKTYGNRKRFDDQNFEEIDEATAPIIKFINTIIENALLNGASDIHIEPQEIDMRVRFRIDGVLREIMTTSGDMIEAVVSRIKIMSDLNIAERRIPQDGKISYRVNGKNIDLRISTVNTMWGEKVVMRILDKSNFVPSLEGLGLNDAETEKMKRIISKPHGIILVCGPTGSGKTTTLYSILNELNDVSKNIITIEDPVEYNFKSINQMQVNPKIGFNFATGLRAILRQDPDIIMVGEIRDAETAEISVRSALTGHLVLSTIHTNNSVGTITRLEDMEIKPFLLSSTVVGVIAQRLVRKICPNCVQEYDADRRELNLLGLDHPVKLKEGKGCSLCNGSGYKGRTAIFEVLEVSREIKNLIDGHANEEEIEQLASREGMMFLREACLAKVLQGITTVDEMLRVTYGD